MEVSREEYSGVSICETNDEILTIANGIAPEHVRAMKVDNCDQVIGNQSNTTDKEQWNVRVRRYDWVNVFDDLVRFADPGLPDQTGDLRVTGLPRSTSIEWMPLNIGLPWAQYFTIASCSHACKI